MTARDWLFWTAIGLVFAVSLGVIVGHIIVNGAPQ